MYSQLVTLKKSAAVGGSILGGATLVLGIIRMSSGNWGESDGVVLDLVLGVVINGGVGTAIGGIVGAIQDRRHGRNDDLASGGYLRIQTNDHDRSSPTIKTSEVLSYGDISEFLEKFPRPSVNASTQVVSSDSAKPSNAAESGWYTDPTHRYGLRFHQGNLGETGWTDLVRQHNHSFEEQVDILDFHQLLELDRDHPVPEEEPIDFSRSVGNAGWYSDPSGFFRMRFWSGQAWTLNCKTEDGEEIQWASLEPPSEDWWKARTVRDFANSEPEEDRRPIANEIIKPFSSQETRLHRVVELFDRGLITREQLDSITEKIFHGLDE